MSRRGALASELHFAAILVHRSLLYLLSYLFSSASVRRTLLLSLASDVKVVQCTQVHIPSRDQSDVERGLPQDGRLEGRSYSARRGRN